MATTKKINELNKATTIGVNDLMVLAQSGEKEATSTTVGALVDKVATQISDGALIEHLAGLSKQKQVLANALNDKGAELSATSTLDEMAGAVKNLDVIGEKTALKGPVLCGVIGYGNTIFSDTGNSRLLPLTEHNLYAYFNARNKKFCILKFANDSTYETVASVTLTEDTINTNAYNNYIEMFSNIDETKIVLRTQSTSGSYSYICFSFAITYGATVTIEQIGSPIEYTTYSNQQAVNGAVMPDGTKFISFQNNYQRARFIDFVNGTSEEVSFVMDKNYAYGYNNAVVSYKVDEDGFGVGMFGYAGTEAAFKVQFDFEKKTISYLGAVYLPSAKITDRNHQYQYRPYYIADKKIIVVMLGKSTYPSGYSNQEEFMKAKVEFIAIDAKNGGIVKHMTLRTNMTSLADGSYASLSGDSYFYSKLENERILVGVAKRGIVEYDAENNKVFVHGTDKELFEGDFLGQVSIGLKDKMFQYNQTPIVSHDSTTVYSHGSNYGECNSITISSSYAPSKIYKDVVWGDLYKRNGNEIVRTSFFEPSLYEAGAYAEKDSVEYLNLSEAEG